MARQLGVGSESLRSWVRQAEVDAGQPPGTTTEDAQRIAELEREVRELRRANEILKAASLDSESQGNTLGRGSVAEALAGVVQSGGQGVEVGLAIQTQIDAFR